MKKLTILLTLVLAMGLAGSAFATHWETLVVEGDCYGWTANGNIKFATGLETLDVDYEVFLMQDGEMVKSWAGVVTVDRSYHWLEMDVDWEDLVCGEYTLSGYFHLQVVEDETATFDTSFICDCPNEDGCFLTPGYWKNHPENWPVMELTFGDMTLTQAELLPIFGMPTRGNILIIMAQHLIAAKLNVANGNDASIQGAIDDGDAWLIIYPGIAKPGKADKEMIEAVKDLLADYNEQGCVEDEDDFDDDMMKAGGDVQLQQKSPGQSTTWGALKDTYR